VDNVRKEKSIYLKEDGKKIILTKESTKVGTSLSGEKISNTERMSIELERGLLSVQPLNEEHLKALYSDFVAGKTPGVIIKERGFHPQVVEIEYGRFLRTDKMVPPHIAAKLFSASLQSVTIERFREKFDSTGNLSLKDFHGLLNLMMNEYIEHGFLSYLQDTLHNVNVAIPRYCSRPVCAVCKALVPGWLYLNQSEHRNQLATSSFYCSRCR
jgi:hypothetical protein